jgi:hypothetical protein
MQSPHNRFSGVGPLKPLDHGRFPEPRWTRARDADTFLNRRSGPISPTCLQQGPRPEMNSFREQPAFGLAEAIDDVGRGGGALEDGHSRL